MLRPGEPEGELLFCLVRTAGDAPGAKARIGELVRGDLDWSTILDLATRHGLLSQLHQTLSDFEEAVPADVSERLAARHRANALNNLEYTRTLHQLLETFEEHDIRALPYKGPTLATYAYGGLENRWFGDLDVLVAKDDILRARELLLDHGYEQTNAHGIDTASLMRDSIFRWEQEFRFINDDTRVELRYQFAGKQSSHSDIFADLWSRRVDLSLAGRMVHALSPEDRALLLLRHGTKHGWCRLSWVYDLAKVMQQDIDWDEVHARATQYQWRTAVLLGLGVTAELAAVELPRTVRHEITQNTRANWGTAVLTTLYQRDHTGQALDWDPWTVVLFLTESWRDAVREGCHVVFSPSIATYNMLPLPSALYSLYYLLRPIELLQKLLE